MPLLVNGSDPTRPSFVVSQFHGEASFFLSPLFLLSLPDPCLSLSLSPSLPLFLSASLFLDLLIRG